MKCQQLVRNNKQFWFFPDISVDDQTKGFLIADDHVLLHHIKEIWTSYTHVCEIDEIFFSMFLRTTINNENVINVLYESYLALPNSQLIVVGRAIPKHNVLVKKKRISAI